jgi:hypothetical protein
MAKWLAALIILFPLSLQQLDYRSGFARGLSLHLKKSSPAYAALEDIGASYSARNEIPQYQEITTLAPGKQRFHPVIATVGVRRLALKPMVIRETFQAREPLQANEDLRMESRGGLLPLEERKRELVQYFRNQKWTGAPSIQQKANELIQQELAENSPNADARIVVGEQTHTAIVVARPGADLSALTGHGGAANISGTGYVGGTTVTRSQSVASSQPPSNSTTVAMNDNFGMREAARPSLAVSPLSQVSGSSKLLQGELEIKDGLAFMGPETFFTLHRVDDGNIYETGRVLVSEARFEIYVKEPRGRLVAELRSRDGKTLGRGSVDLEDPSSLGQMKIQLVPVASGAYARVSSGYSDGNSRVPVSNAVVSFDQNGLSQRVADDGTATDPDRAHRSTYVVKAQASKYWSTIALGVEGENQEIRLYPESLVKSLLDLTTQGAAEHAMAERKGIVWGRMLKKGKPVSGVEVELAGNYEPVYFNQAYIPDKTRSSTDENGLFAFLSVNPGVQAVRIKYNGKIYPAQIFPAESHQLSYVEIHLETDHSVNVAVQDAFDVRKNISAHVRFVGIDDDVVINGEQKLHYPAGPSAMQIEADAGPEYQLARTQVLKSDTHMELPLIRRDWLKSMVDIKQINLLPQRGTVVGMVADQPFQVQLTGYVPPDTPQLVYFDSTGQIADGDSGPAGGGFVIFNAPLGLQTLQVKPLVASNQMFSQAFVAEPEFVQVFKYSFAETY